MITIAHRLLAVGNADKVGVMEEEKGRFGSQGVEGNNDDCYRKILGNNFQ